MTHILRGLAASLLLRLADPLWRSSCRRSQRDSRTRRLWRRFWRAALWLAPHIEKENAMSTPTIYYSHHHRQYIMSTRPPGPPHTLEKENPMNDNYRPHQFYHTPEQLALQTDLNRIARALKRLHASDQVHWLVYLLEALEGLYDPEQSQHIPPILRALHATITTRLRTGSW